VAPDEAAGPCGVATAVAAAVAMLVPALGHAQSTGFTGDLGLAAYARSEVVRDTGSSLTVLPYVLGNWGPFFGRLDTFGYQALPLGSGHLELVGRVSTEGWKADAASLRGLGDRSAPVPIGVGTFQRNAYGALILYAMHDLTSGGAFVEALLATKFELGPLHLYPLLGAEYRSAAYVRHLYGVDAAQSAASGVPVYAPGASIVPMAGLAAMLPIHGPWALQFTWRHRWLDGAITGSPIVTARTQESGHIGLTYTFK
jgi:outer membrane protein